MMKWKKEIKEIRDDQIRIIGEEKKTCSLSGKSLALILSILVIVVIGIIFIVAKLHDGDALQGHDEEEIAAYFEPVKDESEPLVLQPIGKTVDVTAPGFTEIRDTTINDIPIRIFIPHNAEMSLHIGRVDKNDTTIIYTAQAADVRADNGGIVGAFVRNGEPLAWGLSKKGFCASIKGKVTIGVVENSPLFEEATEKSGHFFRQYPLVCDGKIVDNELKGKSVRRGICVRKGEIFMVETGTAESFHDFSQALVDLGVEQAVYLVGSSAYGWAVDENGERHEFGEENLFKGRRRIPKNTNYIVWRKK